MLRINRGIITLLTFIFPEQRGQINRSTWPSSSQTRNKRAAFPVMSGIRGGNCARRGDLIPKNAKSKQAVAQTEIPLSGH